MVVVVSYQEMFPDVAPLSTTVIVNVFDAVTLTEYDPDSGVLF
jgi:hypothetical protein